MEIKPYAIFKDARIVRVKHNDLDKPWASRGTSVSRCEHDMKLIEGVLTEATGLKRLYRRHNRQFGFVDYHLSRKTFAQAALALVMTYAADPFWEGRMKTYPATSQRK